MRHGLLIGALSLVLLCLVGCGDPRQEAAPAASPPPADAPLESELSTSAVPVPVGSHPRLGPSIVPADHIGTDTPFQFMRMSFSGLPLDEYWVGYPTEETVWALDGSAIPVDELERELQMHAPSSFDVEVREAGTLSYVNVHLEAY